MAVKTAGRIAAIICLAAVLLLYESGAAHGAQASLSAAGNLSAGQPGSLVGCPLVTYRVAAECGRSTDNRSGRFVLDYWLMGL